MSETCLDNNKLVFTPQERQIEEQFSKSQKGRERTFRRLNAIRQSPFKIGIDRARLLTESFMATEGKPLVLRWAMALKNIAEKMLLYIGDDDLIIGKGDSQTGRCGILYPEVDGSQVDKLQASTQETAKVLKEIAAYWKNNTLAEKYAESMPEETRRLIYGDDPENIYKQLGLVMPSGTARSAMNYTQDFQKVVDRGIKDIKLKALAKLNEIESPVELVEKGPFLEAVITTCDAIVLWAHRYAELARKMAKTENDSARKEELLAIAQTCEWVPENPARTFREALQTQWFVQIFSRIEQKIGAALGNGRMDQYLYPYYIKDLKEGRITKEKAKELFESLWLNMSEAMMVFITPTGGIGEGYAHFEGVTLGGRMRDGKDATNELSYLILESKDCLPMPYPDLGVRIHAQTPNEFLRCVCEVIKTGQGYPKLLNDEEVIPLYLFKGIPYEDALDYSITGCVEHRVPNYETYINPCGVINMPIALELALNNGKTKVYGDSLLGLKTGDPKEFATFDDLMEAYRAQHLYLLKHLVAQQAVIDTMKTEFFAAPFTSMIHDRCIEQCKDINGNIENSFIEQFHDAVGFGTVIDSLAAIKKLVYDDKIISMFELLEALATNFEGKETIREMCLNASKYGNNDPYADLIGKQIEKLHMDYLASISGLNGELLTMRMVPVTNHIAMGKVTGASANGRKAGIYLSEGTSASQGSIVKDPMALLLSNANTKNISYKGRQARLLNLDLSPKSVEGEEGTEKLMSLIRNWCDMKLYHIQFNIINKETLLAAQKNPEKYKDLIINVAGYNDYFTKLPPDVQDEIIARTEYAV
jgi:pyruvate formate-lyase/glycerol dehydratase family glycyl radical enzyme